MANVRKSAAPRAQTKRSIEVRVQALVEAMGERQQRYHRRHGKYWQGLRTHSAVPGEEGGAPPPDRLDRTPSDHAEDWTAFGLALPAGLECALQVDTYGGPEGEGYTLTATVEVGGAQWSMTKNVGPETWRERDWERADPL